MKKSIILIISCFCLTTIFSQNDTFGSNVPDTSKSNLYIKLDVQAEYPGGNSELRNFIGSNLAYPQKAIDAKIEGRIIIRFCIDISGSVVQIQELKGIDNCPECTQECIRVLQLMPKWKPAELKGKPINSFHTIPFNFRIPVEEESEKKNK
ncbi:MAG: energy transducer TonB [Fluviicola sp.]|nr:energy transducer TonB [Fluviicola sp.]